MPVTIKPKLDTSQFDNDVRKMLEKMSKGPKVKPTAVPTAAQGGAQRQTGSMSQQFTAGSQNADRMTSGLDEMARGGFYNALSDKMQFAKSIKDSFKKKPGAQGPAGGSAADSAEQKTGPLSQAFNNPNKFGMKESKVQRMIVQRAEFRGPVKGMGGGSGGGMFNRGGSGEDSGRGGLFTNVGKSMPYVGAILAIAGGILKMVSNAGQKYADVMMSQSGTWGATGGYVGGGGGYFDNAQIAQGSVDYFKGFGSEDAVGKGNPFKARDITFAAQQGIGMSEYGRNLGIIQKNAGGRLAMDMKDIKGWFNASGVQGMEQSKVMAQLAQAAEQSTSGGYGALDPRAIMQYSAGFSNMSNIRASRGIDITTNLDRSIKQEGSLAGNMAMMSALESGAGIWDAMRAREKGLSGAAGQSGLANLYKMMGPDAAGYLLSKEGIGSFTEMSSGVPTRKAFGKDGSVFPAGSNTALANQNQVSEAIISNPGFKASFEASNRMMQHTLEMMRTAGPALATLAEGVQAAEEALYKGGKVLVEGVDELAKDIPVLVENIHGLIDKIKSGGSLVSILAGG